MVRRREKAVLLLNRCKDEKRYIGFAMKLGGYETYEVRDVMEAVNLAATMPGRFHCLALSGTLSRPQLKAELDVLNQSGFNLPVVLLGQAGDDVGNRQGNSGSTTGLQLRLCPNDRLLEMLAELDSDEDPVQS